MRAIHIFSHGSEHTTARYFERAARADAKAVIYWDRCPDIAKLEQEDMFVFIDPAPDWPLGLESVKCLTAAYFIDVHQDIRSRLQLSRFFDVVFVAQKDYVTAFHEIGHQHAYWLPLACDPDIHRVTAETRIFDVGFVGKLGQRGTPRNKILSTVLPRYQTNDYLLFYLPQDMGKVYGQSKIVFNASINGDLNMRIFEALASGALLVTDRIDNGLTELFEEGIHYVGYSTIEEAIKKIDYYLDNDAERNRIATEGQRLALASHTYRHRWVQIMQLEAHVHGQAPARSYSRRKLSELYSDIFVSLRMPGRLFAVIVRYGLSKIVVSNLVKSWGRWLNARIPLTPNAIRARRRSK